MILRHSRLAQISFWLDVGFALDFWQKEDADAFYCAWPSAAPQPLPRGRIAVTIRLCFNSWSGPVPGRQDPADGNPAMPAGDIVSQA
jgi:hypothetical protein